MASAELFPDPETFKRTTFKEPTGPCGAFISCFKFMMSRRGQNTVVVIFDGRNNKIRRLAEDARELMFPDEKLYLDQTIVYQLSNGPKSDNVRAAKKAKFQGQKNVENVVGVLPASKSQFKTKPRTQFCGLGETSTDATTYTNVARRPLQCVPRMDSQTKQEVTGVRLPVYGEDVTNAIGEKGHALFWLELKEIDIYHAIFKDLNVSHVLDLTPGSGAAATAAMMEGIHYEGVAMNQKHCNWLKNYSEKAGFAVIGSGLGIFGSDKKDAAKQELVEGAQKYFGNIVQEGMMYIVNPNVDALSVQPEVESVSENEDCV